MKKMAKWLLISAGSTLLIILIGITLILGAIGSSQKQGSEPDFMGYEATMPLAGSNVTKTYVIHGSSFASKTYVPKYEQTYDSGVVVTQQRHGDSIPVLCDLPEGQNTTTYECSSGDIKGGGAYSVTIARVDGEIYYVDVYARIDGTRMDVYVPENVRAKLAEYTQWQEYFNSMQPVDLATK